MLPRCSDSASFQFVLASNCCSGSHRAPDKWANQSKTKRANQQKNNCARPTETACCDERDLYAGTATRHLYRLNADTGSVLSDLPTESEPRGHLIVAGAALIVFLGDEILASFDVPLNKLKWSAEASKMWTSARPYLWRGVVLAGICGHLEGSNLRLLSQPVRSSNGREETLGERLHYKSTRRR